MDFSFGINVLNLWLPRKSLGMENVLAPTLRLTETDQTRMRTSPISVARYVSKAILRFEAATVRIKEAWDVRYDHSILKKSAESCAEKSRSVSNSASGGAKR